MPPIFPNEEKFPGGVPEHGVLFLDEYLQAPQDVRKAAARLLEERKIGDYSLDDFGHWVVFAASNRAQDRSGTGKPMAFETNRKLELEIEPDLDSWVAWATVNSVHPLFIAFAKANPGLVFTDKVPDHGKPFATPRSFVRCNRLLQTMAKSFGSTGHHGLPLEHPAAIEVAGGLIGMEVAATLLAFLSMADQLPSYEEIVASPKKAQVPGTDRADALYAVSEMIAFRAKKDDMDSLVTYIERMPEEFQLATVASILKRSKERRELMTSRQLTDWMSRHTDLIGILTD